MIQWSPQCWNRFQGATTAARDSWCQACAKKLLALYDATAIFLGYWMILAYYSCTFCVGFKHVQCAYGLALLVLLHFGSPWAMKCSWLMLQILVYGRPSLDNDLCSGSKAKNEQQKNRQVTKTGFHMVSWCLKMVPQCGQTFYQAAHPSHSISFQQLIIVWWHKIMVFQARHRQHSECCVHLSKRRHKVSPCTPNSEVPRLSASLFMLETSWNGSTRCG